MGKRQPIGREVHTVNDPQKPSTKAKRWWYLLILAPVIGSLFPGLYGSLKPELWGIPYFYWYQMLWIIIAAIITAFLYNILKDD
nr:DUF3311 domain-containing protein [Alicyclobacillus mali (ex Roth et al. 2021)]